MKFFKNTWAIWFLFLQILLQTYNFWQYFNGNDHTTFRLVANIIACLFTLLLIYWSRQEIVSIRNKYKVLKDYPSMLGHKPVWGELFYSAITMEQKEVFELSQPYFAQYKRDLLNSKMESIQRQKRRWRLQKRNSKQTEEFWLALDELHEWRIFLKEALKNTLAKNFDPLLNNIQLNPDLRQQIKETLTTLKIYHDQGGLDGPYNLELFSQIFKTGIGLSDLIKKSEAENERIDQLKLKLSQQAEAMLKNPALKTRLSTEDVNILQEVKNKASQPLKPRELRTVVYNFDKVANSLPE